MKSFRRAAILGAVALMATGLMACRASAGDGYIARAVETPFSWTGFYVSVGGGYQSGGTDLSLATPGPVVDLQGLSARGPVYDGRVGFDLQVPNTIFVVGAFGGYARGPAEFDLNFSSPGGSANLLHYEVEQDWYVGARGGVLINPATLVYVGYKYQHANVSASTGIPGGPGQLFSKDVAGHGIVAGLESRFHKNWAVSGEYGYTRFDSFDALAAGGGCGGCPVQLNTRHDDHSGMVRLTFRP